MSRKRTLIIYCWIQESVRICQFELSTWVRKRCLHLFYYYLLCFFYYHLLYFFITIFYVFCLTCLRLRHNVELWWSVCYMWNNIGSTSIIQPLTIVVDWKWDEIAGWHFKHTGLGLSKTCRLPGDLVELCSAMSSLWGTCDEPCDVTYMNTGTDCIELSLEIQTRIVWTYWVERDWKLAYVFRLPWVPFMTFILLINLYSIFNTFIILLWYNSFDKTITLTKHVIQEFIAWCVFFLAQHDAFKIFLKSIFYIGKGRQSRPYEHFKEAMSCCQKTVCNNKVYFNFSVIYLQQYWYRSTLLHF